MTTPNNETPGATLIERLAASREVLEDLNRQRDANRQELLNWVKDYDLNRQKAHDFSRGMNAVIVIVPS